MIKEFNFKDSSIKETNLSVNSNFTDIEKSVLNLVISKSHSHKQGNNHSKDRSEIAGSSKKLFKQKGTGNARAGNAKTGIRRGGGKAFGPKFHKVNFKVNKKTIILSKISSLILKIQNNNLYLFDENDLNAENFAKTLKTLNHKSMSFVFKNTKELDICKKFSNYKNLSFMSDSTYSVFKSLKNDALFLSKSTDLYQKHLSEIIK